ncbi:MAG: CvpA family protein [Rhodanobacteraceae bacterium]
MNGADYIILSVLALSVLFGLWRGLVAEVLALVCWIAAFWVAWLFGDKVAAWYGQWLHEASVRIVAGYLTCFLGVLVVGALLGWGLRVLMRGSGLSGSDRTLGMIFGLVRGVLLVTVAVLIMGFTAAPREPWWRQSRLMPSFEQSAGWLSQHLPAEVTQYLKIGARALPAAPRAPISEPAAAATISPVAGSSQSDLPQVRRDRRHPGNSVGQ